MEAIEVKGIEVLTPSQKRSTNKLLNEYYVRIQRQLRNFASLRVHIKAYEKEGSRKKYSIRAEAISPTRKFESNAHDWDFVRALHKGMNKVMSEIEHETHSSDQKPKGAIKLKRMFKTFSR